MALDCKVAYRSAGGQGYEHGDGHGASWEELHGDVWPCFLLAWGSFFSYLVDLELLEEECLLFVPSLIYVPFLSSCFPAYRDGNCSPYRPSPAKKSKDHQTDPLHTPLDR